MSRFKKIFSYLKEKGFWWTLRKVFCAIFYRAKDLIMDFYLTFKPKRSFNFRGQAHQYLYRVYNQTWRGERTVEIPIIWRYVTEAKGKRILEVGNVLQNYYSCDHDILDKYEPGPGVINDDVLTFKPEYPYDLIVSISTMEHVGWDEEKKEPDKIKRSFENLKKCLAPHGKIVATMPLGYNRHLDNFLREGSMKFDEQYFMKRISQTNEWREVSHKEVEDAIYGYPYHFANAIVIGIYHKK